MVFKLNPRFILKLSCATFLMFLALRQIAAPRKNLPPLTKQRFFRVLFVG
jgi:hypothetical protein